VVVNDGAFSSNNFGCINQDQTGNLFYDQNTDTWHGNVFVARDVALDSARALGRKPMVFLWEDDSGSKCDYQPKFAGQPQDDLYLIAVGMVVGGISGFFWGFENSPIASIVSLGSLALGWTLIANADDPIGLAGNPASLPGANPKTIYKAQNHTTTLAVAGSVKFESQP
jgi:hypothetical protein